MKTLIEEQTLRTLAGSDPETLLPIIEEFATNSQRLLSNIEHAINNKELGAARKDIHQLKGSSGMLGMIELFRFFKAFEDLTIEDIPNNHLAEARDLTERSVQEAIAFLSNPPS